MEINHSLFLLLLIPLLGSVLVWFLPKSKIRIFSLSVSGFILGLIIYLLTRFEMSQSGLEQGLSWLNSLGIDIQLKLDSTSSWFVLLSGFVSFVAMAMKGDWIDRHPKIYFSFALFLVFSLFSAFLSTNLIFFYLSYESVFIPMIFIVGIWGKNSKASSVFRFFLMSFLGSILMLVSIFYLSYLNFVKTGAFSSNLNDVIALSEGNSTDLFWCFLGFLLAFSIKIPLFPLHGWLKDVYVNAPGPATVWMSAVLSKLGVFGFIRFIIPLFPSYMLAFQGALLALAAVTIVYSAFLAIQSNEPKTLLAYSSISHLGFVMLGVFSLNQSGKSAAIVLSLSHGLTSALLFYLNDLIHERKPGIDLQGYSGMAKKFPVLFSLLFVGVLSGVSLPGTMNFIGEFLVLNHAYSVSALCTLISSLGVVLGAVYMLKFYQRMGFGETSQTTAVSDISGLDLCLALALVALILYFGFQPSIILQGVSNG